MPVSRFNKLTYYLINNLINYVNMNILLIFDCFIDI